MRAEERYQIARSEVGNALSNLATLLSKSGHHSASANLMNATTPKAILLQARFVNAYVEEYSAGYVGTSSAIARLNLAIDEWLRAAVGIAEKSA